MDESTSQLPSEAPATTRVSIKNRNGDSLVAIMHGELSETVIVLCHGMLSTKDSAKHVRLAEELADLGFSVLRFDFSGCGESEGRLFDLTFSREIEDLDAVIDWLAGQGARRFGVVGSSMGGSVALLTAARDERIVAVATIAAVAHPSAIDERYPDRAREWREQGYVQTDAGQIGRAYYDDAMAHDVAWAASVLLAPILVIHGTRDEVVPPSDGHDLACAARRATLIEIDEADHRLTHPQHLGEALAQVRRFMVKELGEVALQEPG